MNIVNTVKNIIESAKSSASGAGMTLSNLDIDGFGGATLTFVANAPVCNAPEIEGLRCPVWCGGYGRNDYASFRYLISDLTGQGFDQRLRTTWSAPGHSK